MKPSYSNLYSNAKNRIMNSATKWSIEKELLYFFIITNILSWLLWLPSLLKASSIGEPLSEELLLKLGNFMPSTTALVLVAVTMGKTGIVEIFNRTIKFRYALNWYLYTLFLMPAILTVAYFVSYFTTGLQFESILVPIIFPQMWPLVLLIAYFIVMQGPLGEELGWRGYALPRLLQIFNPLKCSLILGVVWSVWHFPKFFIAGTTQYDIMHAYGILITLAGYTLYTIMLTIMMTLLFIKTGGSIWSAILFHAMANFSHGLITILNHTPGGISILLVILVVTSMLLLRFKDEFCYIKKAPQV